MYTRQTLLTALKGGLQYTMCCGNQNLENLPTDATVVYESTHTVGMSAWTKCRLNILIMVVIVEGEERVGVLICSPQNVIFYDSLVEIPYSEKYRQSAVMSTGNI